MEAKQIDQSPYVIEARLKLRIRECRRVITANQDLLVIISELCRDYNKDQLGARAPDYVNSMQYIESGLYDTSRKERVDKYLLEMIEEIIKHYKQ